MRSLLLSRKKQMTTESERMNVKEHLHQAKANFFFHICYLLLSSFSFHLCEWPGTRLVLPLSVTLFPVDVPSIGGFLFLARVLVNFSSS